MRENEVKDIVDEQQSQETRGEAVHAVAGEGAPEGAGSSQPDPAAEALVEQPAQIDQLQAELKVKQDQLLRQAAEFQNYRRRTEQEKTRLIEYGRSQVVQQLLDVVDDFRRSLEAADQAAAQQENGVAYQALREGVDLVFRKLMDELGRLGVAPIDAVGHPFSEQEHEAVMQQPAPEGTPPGIVLHEVQKGYRMGDRVLRHSKVVVSA
jgi:molecular chaperone GrpE